MVWPACCGRRGETEICTHSQEGIDLGADARAGFGKREPRQHRFEAAHLNPGGQQILQRVGTGGIGVGVAIDITACGPRRLDHGQDLRRLAPIVDTRALQVDDLDMNPAIAGEVDRFLDAFEHLVRFVSDMGEISRLVALQHGAERKHLRGLGKAAGRREQTR